MTTCMSCLPTGGPVQENSGGAQREETPAHYTVLPTSQNPSCCNPSWLKDAHATRRTLWVSEVAQSCPTLCDPMDCSLQCSSVHGIFQARVLEWVAISFSRGSSWPRDQTQVSRGAGRQFTVWAYPLNYSSSTITSLILSGTLLDICWSFSCYYVCALIF